MFGLDNPDKRRGLRSVVQAIVALVLIGLLWWLVELLRDDHDGLKMIAKGALLITGLGTLFYGMENTTRAFGFAFGKDGLKFDAGNDAPAAAQAVADSAQQTADVIKEEVK